MKRFLIALSVFLALVISPARAWSQAPAPAPDKSVASQALNPEDIIKMREQLKVLSQAMGNPMTPPPATSAAKPEEHKSVGDVADKALGLFTGAIGTLSESLKKIAPEVWRIMIKQQYAEAISQVIVPIGLFVLSLVFYFSFRKKLSEIYTKGRDINQNSRSSTDMDSWAIGGFAGLYLSIIVSAIVLVIALQASTAQLINPEYYAIKDLVGIVTGGPAAAPQ